MAHLQTTYLGLPLKTPLIAGASPLSKNIDSVKQLEDEGVGAIVMFSLFAEEINDESLQLNHFLNRGAESQPEAQTYMVEPDVIRGLGERYLAQIQKIKQSVDIPVIASLNGTASNNWYSLAKDMEAAGADALELNVYELVTDPEMPAAQVEKRLLTLISLVSASVTIPVAVKLTPYITSLPNFLARACKAGADGFVLFNRFMQPVFDIEALDVEREATLSSSADLSLPSRWIAILFSRLPADLALSSGIHTAEDLIKAIMAGANVGMAVSALLEGGIPTAGKILKTMDAWMDANAYESVDKMRGSLSLGRVENPAAYERANYIASLRSFDKSKLLNDK